MDYHDIYSFFGRKIEYIERFKGEIISDLRNRKQGFRIKFKMNKNQIKMHDKGNNLRIEVTINNPTEFKVLKNDDETGSKSGNRWARVLPISIATVKLVNPSLKDL